MRDLEFLPDWYPRLVRQKRMLKLQGWLTLVILVVLGLWMILAKRNVQAAQGALTGLERQTDQTKIELSRLAELNRLNDDLGRKDQIVTKVGVPLESSRLFSTLESLMPREMSLTNFTMETEEEVHKESGLTRMRPPTDPQASVDRRMKVKLQGLAPSEATLSSFYNSLSALPFMNDLAVSYANEKIDKGFVMREFEIRFSMSLNTLGSN